jgi:hypothetical protein
VWEAHDITAISNINSIDLTTVPLEWPLPMTMSVIKLLHPQNKDVLLLPQVAQHESKSETDQRNIIYTPFFLFWGGDESFN